MNPYYEIVSTFCDHLKELLFLVDENLTVFYVNPAIENFFSIPRSEIENQDFIAITQRLFKKSPFSPDLFNSLITKHDFLSIAHNAEKEAFYIHWHFSTLHLQPYPKIYNIVGNLVSFKNQNLHSNLLNLANFMPGDLYWKNKEGYYLGCNQAMLEKLNLSSVTEIVGKKDEDLWPDTADSLRKNDLKVMENKRISSLEEIVQIPNQPEMIFTTVKAPLFNKNNQVIGIIGNSLDITKQKAIQKQLESAKKLAEINNKLKTEFIHNTQHDIRTPLSGIYSCSQLLMLSEEDPERKNLLQQIQNAVQCVMDYCQSIVEFSKLESDHIPILLKSFNYPDLLKKVIDLEKPALYAKKLAYTLDYNIPPNTPIITDSFRLERILVNLISNAIKFTHHGSIDISTWLKDDELYICIKDTGIGVPKNKQAIIFNTFVRLSESDLSPFKGQGLGLSLVKQFTEDLSGKITIDSEVNKGSAFTVCIPLGKQETEEL